MAQSATLPLVGNTGYPEEDALFSMADYHRVWETEGRYIPPVELIRQAFIAKMKANGLRPEDGETPAHKPFFDILNALESHDPVTGLERPRYEDMNLLLMEEYARWKGESSASAVGAYLFADLSNLRGLNYALSGQDITKGDNTFVTRKDMREADKVMRVISLIMMDEIDTLYITKGQTPNSIVYRNGGDEFSAIAPGMTVHKLDAAMEKANARIATFLKKAGIDTIAHAKPDSRDRPGVDVTSACCAIDEQFEIHAANERLDRQIGQKKRATAVRKTAEGVVPKTQLTVEEIKHVTVTADAELEILQNKLRSTHPKSFEQRQSAPFAGIDPNEQNAPSEKRMPTFLWGSLLRKRQCEKVIAQNGYTKEQDDLLRGRAGNIGSSRPHDATAQGRV